MLLKSINHFYCYFEEFYYLLTTLSGMWDLSSPTSDRTCAPSIGRQGLNHWVGKEVPPIPLPQSILNKVIWVFFLLLQLRISLYILDINPLSDTWFAIHSSITQVAFFTLLIVSFDIQKFLIWWSPVYLVLLLLLCFWYHSEKIISKSKHHEDFLYITTKKHRLYKLCWPKFCL